jgi:NADH-quinone oxidoreductase subunit E
MKVTTYEKPKQDGFAFTPENLERAQAYIARYPEERKASAVIWLLYIAQEQNGGYLTQPAIHAVAALLGVAPIRVVEVVSFYTMFQTKPVGRHLIQVCRTTSCWLRGADDIVQACLEEAGTSRLGEVSEDGAFSVVEVECLGSCCNAPMIQVNDANYYEDLTPETVKKVIAALRRGEAPKAGSQAGRVGSEPDGGRTTLLESVGE